MSSSTPSSSSATTAADPNKPTFILIIGAWHGPSTWDKVVALLEPAGHKCVAVALPTATSNDPSASLSDDLRVVRAAITAGTESGSDVIVVAHSYGGFVGESAIKDLTRAPPRASASTSYARGGTSRGRVRGLALMATGFVVRGLSFIESLGGAPPPQWDLDPETGFAYFVVDPKELFYHDLEDAEEAQYWTDRLSRHSARSLTEGGEHTYEGWRDVPVWYLATTEDRAFPVSAQMMMVQMAREARADVTVRQVKSGHSPMLSRPGETAGFLLEAAAAMMIR